jgi:hypothetical protein
MARKRGRAIDRHRIPSRRKCSEGRSGGRGGRRRRALCCGVERWRWTREGDGEAAACGASEVRDCHESWNATPTSARLASAPSALPCRALPPRPVQSRLVHVQPRSASSTYTSTFSTQILALSYSLISHSGYVLRIFPKWICMIGHCSHASFLN